MYGCCKADHYPTSLERMLLRDRNPPTFAESDRPEDSKFCLTRGVDQTGVNVIQRPVLFSGIDTEVGGLSWSDIVCHSIIKLIMLSLQCCVLQGRNPSHSPSCDTLSAGTKSKSCMCMMSVLCHGQQRAGILILLNVSETCLIRKCGLGIVPQKRSGNLVVKWHNMWWPPQILTVTINIDMLFFQELIISFLFVTCL